MISVLQRATVRGKVTPSTVRRRAARLLAALNRPDDDLVIVLTDDDEVQALNREYRGKDAPTDVLSFAQMEGPEFPALPAGVPVALGDVVISLPTADRQVADGCLPRLWPALGNPAEAPPWALIDEVTFLLLHGVLHLIGHDHQAPDETARMEALEATLLPGLLNRRRSA
ncbi:MAG: rRNA maturation RNase YbeY [Myxococcales bacterium]|nr:rRNA maturation RNase YbeY [Myxococcales bacterium]